MILSEVRSHLAQTGQDGSIVGYWVLDDWPRADIHRLLEQIHSLVAEANQSSIFPRPTICGFGGLLDEKRGPSAPFVTDTHYFSMAITNFSPNACDIVALYPYASNRVNGPAFIDWSMSRLLPEEFELLRARGWNPQKHALIGVPQAFGYSPSGGGRRVLPRAVDVATQSAAYCRAGAIALLAYTWHDSNTGPMELYNSPDLVNGLRQGVQTCRQDNWK